MVRLIFKHLRWFDYLSLVAIIGLTVGQVWCMIEGITDSLSDLTQSIIDVNAAKMQGLEVTTDGIWRAAWAMIGYAGIYLAIQVVIAVLAGGISANLGRAIRKDVNDKVTYMAMQDAKHFQTASLITRVSNDVMHVQFTTVIIFRMVFSAPITVIWALIKMGNTSWDLAYVPAIGVLALVIGLALIMGFVLPKFKVQQSLIDKVNGIMRENLNGIRVIRAYNAESYQDGKFGQANDSLTKLSLFTGRMMNAINPIMMIVMNGVTLGIYWVSAYLINGGTFDYASMMSFSMLAAQIIMAFVMMLFMFVMIPRSMICAKRVNEVLDTKAQIPDPEVEEPTTEVGSIEYRDVTFQYPDGDAPVIEHISFKASKGQTVAFIGATGCGKSTLVNLLPRLYDVSEGAILVDGVDVRNLKKSTLRSKIGFVPQKGVLFSGTVKSNIGFGKPGISEQEVKRAADISCAAPFVEAKKDGYDAHIAQGGTNVSGGQRQRLCIARAIATNPEIYVFDDSFSALDLKTDRQVRENLAKECSEATKMIVAQRVGTIMDADLIVCLHEGKMVGCGTHKELLENCQEYREIALSQLSAEELGLCHQE